MSSFESAVRHADPSLIIGAVTFVLAFAVAFAFIWRQLSRGVRVTALYMYPIKSCAGTRLTVAEFDRLGVVRDRRYLIVDEKNDFLNARLHDYCKMALIQPTFEAAPTGAATLVLTAPGQAPLRVPADWDQQVIVSIWGDKIPAGLFSSPHVSKWLSDFMGIPCRLVVTLSDHDHSRAISAKYDTMPHDPAIQVAFQDAFPTLIISEESLKALQRQCSRQLCMEQFRPNIVVAGCKPYEEDSWRKIRVGDVEFNGIKACDRCLFTTVDLSNGKKHPSGEPLTVLRNVRGKNPLTGNDQEGKGWFGMNFVHTQPRGRVCLGDKVTVLETHPPTPKWVDTDR